MTTVLLIIQIMISILLIALILMQKSEGGALGIGGGGGGGGGLMSGRSSASALVKATATLGTLFIINCFALTIFFAMENEGSAFSGDNADKALISTSDSSKDTIPLADETVTVPAVPTEPQTTPTE